MARTNDIPYLVQRCFWIYNLQDPALYCPFAVLLGHQREVVLAGIDRRVFGEPRSMFGNLTNRVLNLCNVETSTTAQDLLQSLSRNGPTNLQISAAEEEFCPYDYSIFQAARLTLDRWLRFANDEDIRDASLTHGRLCRFLHIELP